MHLVNYANPVWPDPAVTQVALGISITDLNDETQITGILTATTAIEGTGMSLLTALNPEDPIIGSFKSANLIYEET